MCWLPMVRLLRIFCFFSEVHKHECQWHVESPIEKHQSYEPVLHIAAFYLLTRVMNTMCTSRACPVIKASIAESIQSSPHIYGLPENAEPDIHVRLRLYYVNVQYDTIPLL